MDPSDSDPDVLGKIDALLTRHRTGAPTRQDLALAEAQAARASIPVLTEIITEDSTIPVLTEAVPATEAKEATTADIGKPPLHIEVAESMPASTGNPVADISRDEATLRQIEESMVQELENRITLEFTATMARTLIELLDHTREHIRHAVREALKQRLGTPPHGAQEDPDKP
jgi:Arc/MetJ family transcription regulator